MYKNFVKRLIDIVISLMALPFFAILFVVIAPIIMFEDKGPIFYNTVMITLRKNCVWAIA